MTVEHAIEILRHYPNVCLGDREETITLWDIIELLKAQEPVAPVRNKDGIYHCGNCGETCVGYEVEFTHSRIKVENYCHICGQAVKWE